MEIGIGFIQNNNMKNIKFLGSENFTFYAVDIEVENITGIIFQIQNISVKAFNGFLFPFFIVNNGATLFCKGLIKCF